MPILHGVDLSPFVRKVRIACAEKGIEYESKPQMPFGDRTDFLPISPLGKIPVWQEGDFSVPDSSVIIDYLERTHPTPSLYPADAQQRATALFLEEYSDTRLVEALTTVFFQRFVRPSFFQEEPDQEIVREAVEEKAPACFDYLQAVLGDDDYLVGNQFSIADIAVSSPFVNYKLGGEEVDAGRWPQLAAHIQRCWSRPGYKAIVEGDLGG